MEQYNETLSEEEYDRYSRQILVEDISEEGQLKLKTAHVCILGAGGLGSAVGSYLAVAGVGTITMCDYDIVSLSNLNRQILHPQESLGEKKHISAAKRMRELNPHIVVHPIFTKIDASSVGDILANADIVVDCLDNFPTRVVANQEATRRCIPYVFAGVSGFSGQLSVFQSPVTPCLYCVFQDLKTPVPIPVVGSVVGVLGSLQATEVIKLITNVGTPLYNTLLSIDCLHNGYRKVAIGKNPRCPVCSV